MEFFTNDPNILRYPPAETRFLDLRAQLDSDGKRLRVKLELLPFQQRPNIELDLIDSAGIKIASTSIIEPISWKLELTLLIRKTASTGGKYTLTAGLFYSELGEVDRRIFIIEIPSPAS